MLALNGLLNLQENAESSLHALFGEDVGVAFFILGKLKRSLQQQREAAQCFRAALRHNPFLWSAFSMLCELGEEACPEECFKVSEYPTFLRPRMSAPPTNQPNAESATGKLASAAGSSAFKPLVPSRNIFMTPAMGPAPKGAVGSAIFSSTPRVGGARGNEVGRGGLEGCKMVLDFNTSLGRSGPGTKFTPGLQHDAATHPNPR